MEFLTDSLIGGLVLYFLIFISFIVLFYHSMSKHKMKYDITAFIVFLVCLQILTDWVLIGFWIELLVIAGNLILGIVIANIINKKQTQILAWLKKMLTKKQFKSKDPTG